MQTINELWENAVKTFAQQVCVGNRQSKTNKNKNDKVEEVISYEELSYQKVESQIIQCGYGLIALGLKEKEGVAVIAENSMRWLVADQAVLGNRAYNVPRGCSSTEEELVFILNHSACRMAFLEDENELKKIQALKKEVSKLKIIIILDKAFKDTDESAGIYSFNDLLKIGKEFHKEHKDELFEKRRKATKPEDTATIMYTSGTSGTPKGIPLKHSNIMHNVETVPFMLNVNSDERFLSILPIWHTFERTIEYCLFRVGAALYYTTRLTVVKDMSVVNPTFMVSVPRIWIAIYNNVMSNIKISGKQKLFEKLYSHSLKVMQYRRYKENRQFLLGHERAKKIKASLKDYAMHMIADRLIYKKVRAKLGNRFVAGVSGGGSLPPHIDDFFEIIGVTILEGYGLTETSPIISCRTFTHCLPYTCGQPIPQTLIKILNDEGEVVEDGKTGVVYVSGPQVMSGYYKNDEETKKVMSVDENGRTWFNTGDLGVISRQKDLTIMGRIKDTIVLIGGENIEPAHIETAILEIDAVEQVLACGQDQESITALIVPNDKELKEIIKTLDITVNHKDLSEINKQTAIIKAYKQLINGKVCAKNGFKDLEKVTNIAFTKPFTPDDDTMTQTFKIKRHKIMERDHSLIVSMYPRFNNVKKG